MPTIDLPPLLLNLNQFADSTPGFQRVANELYATHRVIARLRELEPDADEITQLDSFYKSPFTGPGVGECPTCRRKF